MWLLSKSANPGQTRRRRRSGWSGSTLFAYVRRSLFAWGWQYHLWTCKSHVFIVMCSIKPVPNKNLNIRNLPQHSNKSCHSYRGKYRYLAYILEPHSFLQVYDVLSAKRDWRVKFYLDLSVYFAKSHAICSVKQGRSILDAKKGTLLCVFNSINSKSRQDIYKKLSCESPWYTVPE